MDAAANQIDDLRSDLLPPRPYHIAKALDKRYRVPPDHLRLREEEQIRGLQYMTLLNVDRGLLFTRAYYDMREEPPISTVVAKDNGSEKKPKTKLSLSDYKNKKKAPSPSPPDATVPLPPKPSGLRQEITDAKADRDQARRDDAAGRPRDASESFRDHRPPKPREIPHDDRPSTKLESRPRHDPNDTPEKRKRAQEDDAARPPKKLRPEGTTPLEDRSRTPRDEAPRRKDDRSVPASAAAKDHKAGGAAALPNGRGMLKSALGSQSQSGTPTSRARGDSLNGTRPAQSASTKATPSRHEGPSKSSVPPLLSPLHFPMGGDAASPPKEKPRRREELDEPARPTKPPKVGAPVAAPRKDKARLPALLSPTLPPLVEEELLDREQQGKDSTGSGSAKASQVSEPATNGKKPSRPIRDDEFVFDAWEKSKIMSRAPDREGGRFVLHFEVRGKNNLKMYKRLIALSPRNARSTSLETHGAVAAKKRPPGASESVTDSIAVKRPRVSDVSISKLPPPSTPAKAATSMARVASNNSQAHTPGDANSMTPGDRPPTRQDPIDPARIRSLRERHEHFKRLGNGLKHKRDDLLAAKDGDRPASRDVKLGIALCLESAMAYMVSFRSVFESRRLENKAQDPKAWEGILLMLDSIHHPIGDGRHRALEALFYHLRGVIVEELIKCYWSLDPATNARSVINYERLRSTTWKSAADTSRRVKGDRMRVAFGPWTLVDEAVHESLRVVRRWAAEEGVDWRAEIAEHLSGGPDENGRLEPVDRRSR